MVDPLASAPLTASRQPETNAPRRSMAQGEKLRAAAMPDRVF